MVQSAYLTFVPDVVRRELDITEHSGGRRALPAPGRECGYHIPCEWLEAKLVNRSPKRLDENSHRARLAALAQPVRDKRSRLQRADDLVRLGFQLMAQAEAGAGLRPRVQARLYRDGLMIACLAYRPLRLANFISLELGHHLQRRGSGWWLEIPAAETKTRRAITLPFPEPVVPALERYLAHWRPQLAPPGQAGLPLPCPMADRAEPWHQPDPCPSADYPSHPGGVRSLGQSARLP